MFLKLLLHVVVGNAHVSPLLPIATPTAYPRYTNAATALRTSTNGLAKLAAFMAPLDGAPVEVLDADESSELPVVVAASEVVGAAEVLELLSVAMLMVVFLGSAVPVAAPLAPLAPLAPVPMAPVPTAPVPKAPPRVVVALPTATVVVTELFCELIADWMMALADVPADVADDEEVEELAVEPPVRLKRPE